jgi:hypothetical protein
VADCDETMTKRCPKHATGARTLGIVDVRFHF